MALPSMNPSESTNADRLKGIRILYVEDEADVGALFSLLLDMMGCETRWVCSADAALQESIQDFDLLLSDVQMPGSMDGVSLAENIARQRPELPILLVSGYIPSSERLQHLQACVLAKPVGMTALRDAILQCI